MAGHYSMLLVAWLFLLLIGGWLLINALIDVGARRCRRWIAEWWSRPACWWEGRRGTSDAPLESPTDGR